MLRLALYVVLLCAPIAHGAPVPHSPAAHPLAADELVGQWGWIWGGLTDGRITLYPDGSYRSYHVADGQRFIGTWSLVEGVVTIGEYPFCEAKNEVQAGPVRYEFTLARTADPLTFAGRAAGLTPVVLTKPPK